MQQIYEEKLEAVARQTLAGKSPGGAIATSIVYAREILRLRGLAVVPKVLQ